MLLRAANQVFWLVIFYLVTRGNIHDSFRVLINAIVCILLGYGTDRMIRRARGASRPR